MINTSESFPDDAYETLYYTYSAGRNGCQGVRIQALKGSVPECTSDQKQSLISFAGGLTDKLLEEMLAFRLSLDPETARATEQNQETLKGFFSSPIYMEPLPNGYCNRACCRHLPWYRVTTPIGHFKVGRRKRVYHIEWTDTLVKQEAAELFPEEDVTRYNRVIHAHSEADAKRYVARVQARWPSVPATPD